MQQVDRVQLTSIFATKPEASPGPRRRPIASRLGAKASNAALLRDFDVRRERTAKQLLFSIAGQFLRRLIHGAQDASFVQHTQTVLEGTED